tara:strand:+ start:1149 stop:2762 length:1614 start_codon:yes stop_codon:yes gene_type:complete
MPSRVPLTNLRDSLKGGAPLYIGGDRLTNELPSTPPEFLDDDDQYFVTHYRRRGLMNIVHFPPAGISTVDFVTLFMRNNGNERAYVNVYLGSDISVEMRIAGIQSSLPVYGDVLLVEANGDSSELNCSISSENEVSISVLASDQYDLSLSPPSVVFDPPVNGNMSAFVTLAPSGAISSVTVLNATSHTYDSPPSVRVLGGIIKPFGFFEHANTNTKILGSNQGGELLSIGNLCRTEFASNVSQAGDIILVNNEVRVVQDVNAQVKEFTIDKPLSSSQNTFDEWSYISVLSASNDSYYRIGNGLLSNAPSLGATGLISTSRHNLVVGDYVIYESSSGLLISRRVIAVHSDNEFSVDDNCLLTSISNVAWKYVYIYSQSLPGASELVEVNMISYVKIAESDTQSRVVDLFGLGNRKIYLQNNNFMNLPGSYFNDSLSGNSRVVEFATSASSHNNFKEVPHVIDPFTVLEIILKPQPAPEVQVLSGFPLNGGLATETGKRPLIAVHQRGQVGKSTSVVYWGYYMRYSPESLTNYTQAINI